MKGKTHNEGRDSTKGKSAQSTKSSNRIKKCSSVGSSPAVTSAATSESVKILIPPSLSAEIPLARNSSKGSSKSIKSSKSSKNKSTTAEAQQSQKRDPTQKPPEEKGTQSPSNHKSPDPPLKSCLKTSPKLKPVQSPSHCSKLWYISQFLLIALVLVAILSLLFFTLFGPYLARVHKPLMVISKGGKRIVVRVHSKDDSLNLDPIADLSHPRLAGRRELMRFFRAEGRDDSRKSFREQMMR